MPRPPIISRSGRQPPEAQNHGKGKEQGEQREGQGRRPLVGLLKHFQKSEDVCRHVVAVSGGTCLLAFSGGKDAVASWLQVRRFFRTVVPFYRYLIPDLEFVNDHLAYYERWFGQKIHRVPHPSLFRMLRNLVFQPPERCAIIENANLPIYSYEKTNAHMRRIAGSQDAYIGIGTRATDSPLRAARIRKYGQVNHGERTFLPIFDWRLDDVVGAISTAGVKLPVDYEWFGSSFDGIDYKYLKPIKEHAPRDYQRILSWFPLADLDIYRRDHARKSTP